MSTHNICFVEKKLPQNYHQKYFSFTSLLFYYVLRYFNSIGWMKYLQDDAFIFFFFFQICSLLIAEKNYKEAIWH